MSVTCVTSDRGDLQRGTTVAKSPLQCAGLNRHEAEEEESSRERTSDPLGPEFCVGHREVHDESVNRGIGGVGIELRKDAIRTPTLS